MKYLTYWYQFFTCCEESVPIFHSVKFAKCKICGSTKLKNAKPENVYPNFRFITVFLKKIKSYRLCSFTYCRILLSHGAKIVQI